MSSKAIHRFEPTPAITEESSSSSDDFYDSSADTVPYDITSPRTVSPTPEEDDMLLNSEGEVVEDELINNDESTNESDSDASETVQSEDELFIPANTSSNAIPANTSSVEDEARPNREHDTNTSTNQALTTGEESNESSNKTLKRKRRKTRRPPVLSDFDVRIGKYTINL